VTGGAALVDKALPVLRKGVSDLGHEIHDLP
jgi:hypothetical protein